MEQKNWIQAINILNQKVKFISLFQLFYFILFYFILFYLLFFSFIIFVLFQKKKKNNNWEIKYNYNNQKIIVIQIQQSLQTRNQGRK